MVDVPRLTILARLRELLSNRGYPGRVEDGSVCLGRQNGMTVCVSAAYVLREQFRVRCIQELSSTDETERYTIKLNGPNERPLAEYGFTPARGHHSHRFEGNKKVKGIHLRESGSLAKIANHIVEEIKAVLARPTRV